MIPNPSVPGWQQAFADFRRRLATRPRPIPDVRSPEFRGWMEQELQESLPMVAGFLGPVGAGGRLGAVLRRLRGGAQSVPPPTTSIPGGQLRVGLPAAPAPSTTAPFQAKKFGPRAESVITSTRTAIAPAEVVQRRGVLSDKTVNEFAELVGIRPGELSRLPVGSMLTAEHVVSARNVLKQSAEKVYRLAEDYSKTKSPEALGSLESAWRLHAQYQLGLSGAATETGRALRQFRFALREGIPAQLSPESVAAPNMDRLATELLKAGRLSAANVLGRAAQPTWRDMVVEYATAAKLSGPVTHERNFLGNALAAATRPVERLGTAAVEAVRAGVTRTPRARFAGEALADVVGMGASLKAAARNFVNAILREGATATEQRIAESGRATGRAIPGIAGKVIRMPFRMLTAGDEFFREVNRRGDMYAQAYRRAVKEGTGDVLERTVQILQDAPPDLIENAERKATEFLYQEQLPRAMQQIMGLRNQSLLARVIFPFLKTPFNLARFFVRRTPLALGSAMSAKGPERSERLGRILVGSLISGSSAALAAEGRVSGPGPTDRRKRDMLRATGWQPYSIRIGDTWVSYRGFEPLSSFLATSASLVEAAHDEKDLNKIAGRMAKDAGRFVLDTTYLTGLRDILEAVSDPTGTTAGRILSGTVTGLVPRALSPVQQAFDPTLRHADTVGEAVKRQIPGLSQSVPARLDPLGRPIQPAGGRLRGFIPPISRQQRDPILEELIRLDLPLPQPAKTVRRGGKSFEVAEDEWRRMLTGRGERVQRILGRIVSAPGYKHLSDDQKRELLRDLLGDIGRSVRPRPEMLKAKP